jgi:hypothetical protein
VVLDGFDTIDASAVDTSLLGHSYFAGSRSVLSDLLQLLKDGMPPSERFGLVAAKCGEGTFYRFHP